MDLNFVGDSVALLYKVDKSFGKAEVYIDGIFYASIDQFSSINAK